jgi:hypothetical protein
VAEELHRKKFWISYKHHEEKTPKDSLIEIDLFESLFTPDVASGPEPHRFSSPEKNLWYRVFKDGLQVYLRSEPNVRVSPRESADTIEWVEQSSDDDQSIGSFAFVCQVLQFEPSYLRKRLMAERLRRRVA